MTPPVTETLPPVRHLACLIDGSPSGGAAAELGRRCAPVGARLSLVHVDVTPCCPVVSPMGDAWLPDPEAVMAAAQAWLAGEVARRRGTTGVLLRGYPGPELCRWATEAAPDLLVVPSGGGGRLRRALLGDPWTFLDRHAPCAVVEVGASGSWTWRNGHHAVPRTGPAPALRGASCRA